MLLTALVFYAFSAILVLSALMVITARNPVHSVLWLILAFFNAAGLFVMVGAEFIGMILVIVYVGAVAVLFLFVVMMLGVSFSELRKGAMHYVPIGMAIGAVLLFEFSALFFAWEFSPEALVNLSTPTANFEDVGNTRALGQVLYTDYVVPFQLAGLVLFVAMIGAIVLTHRKRPGVRKQIVSQQQARKASDVLDVRKVTPGTGV
jgi:NADH-quinone oxidoreductase subunit J